MAESKKDEAERCGEEVQESGGKLRIPSLHPERTIIEDRRRVSQSLQQPLLLVRVSTGQKAIQVTSIISQNCVRAGITPGYKSIIGESRIPLSDLLGLRPHGQKERRGMIFSVIFAGG